MAPPLKGTIHTHTLADGTRLQPNAHVHLRDLYPPATRSLTRVSVFQGIIMMPDTPSAATPR